jgi:hypothetical protein
MNRRSLLRVLGLGGAAAVGETMPGIGNVWLYGGGQTVAEPVMGVAGIRALKARYLNAALALESQARATEIEAEREYAMTDWGGAL